MFKALWSNTSAEVMCDTIVYSSIRLWARAVEDYYNAIDKASVNTILPHSQCWNLSNSTYLNTDFIKYHYGKNFHKLGFYF